MPRWILPTLVILAALALVPLAMIARARSVNARQPRVHVIQDMDAQGKYKPQQRNPIFADGRAMRRPVAGTVARGQLDLDDHLQRGLVDGTYAETFPMELSVEIVQRGRERYEIFCSPCHGLSGYGDGIVAVRADELLQGTWVPPSSFHAAPANTRQVGHIFNTITNGIRTMPAYGPQIPVEDRWAIVAYVRALQRSQLAAREDVPAQDRDQLQ